MSSEKQIAANRANALKSTGPRTDEGKAAVRLNALRHGLYAATAVLPGESREEFEQLCDAIEAEWRPETPTESIFAERIAVCHWSMRRISMLRFQTSTEDESKRLDRIDRMEARQQRSIDGAVKSSRALRDWRRKQAEAESKLRIHIMERSRTTAARETAAQDPAAPPPEHPIGPVPVNSPPR